MTTGLESINRFRSITQYTNDMNAASSIRDYIRSDEDKPNLNITRLTPEYSTTGNNVENIIKSRRRLIRRLEKEFPSRGRF